MGQGIITNDGKIYRAELYKLADSTSSPVAVKGPFWAAIGNGDSSFTIPASPPPEDPTQTGLKGEQIRKKFTSSDFLVEMSGGAITIGSRVFDVSTPATGILLLQYLFDFAEANFTWKEVGYFGGDIVLGQFYDGSAPPQASGIAGITADFVSPENGAGAGTLDFTVAGTLLNWKAPGSATAGPQLNIGGGGNFKLVDGVDATKMIRVAVNAGTLPGTDATATPTLAAPGTVALNGLNSDTNPTGQVSSNGRLFFVRNIADDVKNNSSQRTPRFLIE